MTVTAIAEDGWCFYRTILHAYSPALDTPENSWALACTLVNALRQQQNAEFDANMKALHMSESRILAADGSDTGRTGVFTQRTETDTSREYISYGGQRRQFVETVADLLNGLITLSDPSTIATGPLIWADVQMFSDVLFGLIGQYAVYQKNGGQYERRLASFDDPAHPYDPAKGIVVFYYKDRIHYELLSINGVNQLSTATADDLMSKLTCRVVNGRLVETTEDELIELAAESARLLAEATTISANMVQKSQSVAKQPESEPEAKQPETETATKQPEPETATKQPEPETATKQPEPETEIATKQPEPETETATKQPEPETEIATKQPEPKPESAGKGSLFRSLLSNTIKKATDKMKEPIGPLFVATKPEVAVTEGVTVDVSALPAWAKDIFKDAKLIPACDGLVFGNDDCIDNYVFRDIKAADTYIQNALARIEGDPKMTEFNDLTTKAANETDVAKKAELEAKLARYYPDAAIKVRYQDDTVETLPLLNPYRNKQARYGLNGEALPQANLDVLDRIVPAEMRTDRRFTAALLESLWYCGSHGNLDDNQRCTPARILGELREWQTLNTERKYPPSHFIQNYVIQALENAKPTAGKSDMLPMFVETPKTPDVSEAPVVIQPPTIPVANPHLLLTRTLGTIGIDAIDFSKRLGTLHTIGTIRPIVPSGIPV